MHVPLEKTPVMLPLRRARIGSEQGALHPEQQLGHEAMDRNDVYHSDPEIMSGTPVFTGTRVPVHTLVDHLASGISLDEFLEDFPTVRREQAVAFLALSEKALVGADG